MSRNSAHRAKLPYPTDVASLQALKPDLVTLPAQTLLFRVFDASGPHPCSWCAFRTFGPLTTARFDHHLDPPRLQDRGLMYLARSILPCLAEKFQDGRLIDRVRGAPRIVGFRLVRDLNLLDFTGVGATRIGASMAISSGDRRTARAWGRATYEAFPKLDGILYCSSMAGNSPCIALFERAADAIPIAPDFNRALSEQGLLDGLKNAAQKIGYGLR